MSITKQSARTSASQSSRRDLRKSLEAYTDERPPTWDPAPGGILVGQLVRYERVDGKFGPCVYAVVADEEDNKHWCIWITTTVLKAEFRRLRPRPGERLAVKRLMDRRNSGGTTCKMHRVEMDRDGADDVPDFDPTEATDTVSEPTSDKGEEVDGDVPF